MTKQGGLESIRSSKNVFLSKLCKLLIYAEFLWGPHHKKNIKVKKIPTIEKMTPQGGRPFGRRGKKIFVEILQTNYIIGVLMGSSSQKTQN